jgi:hypothetical protein
MIAQKHPANADLTRGFCRHGSVCFEDEKDAKIEAFSTAQIRPGEHDLAQINPGGLIPALMLRNHSSSKPKRRS